MVCRFLRNVKVFDSTIKYTYTNRRTPLRREENSPRRACSSGSWIQACCLRRHSTPFLLRRLSARNVACLDYLRQPPQRSKELAPVKRENKHNGLVIETVEKLLGTVVLCDMTGYDLLNPNKDCFKNTFFQLQIVRERGVSWSQFGPRNSLNSPLYSFLLTMTWPLNGSEAGGDLCFDTDLTAFVVLIMLF